MDFKVSQEFHNKYYDEMYDKLVKVILKDGKEIIGIYNDEIFEDNTILVSGNEIYFIKIEDINKMILVDK